MRRADPGLSIQGRLILPRGEPSLARSTGSRSPLLASHLDSNINLEARLSLEEVWFSTLDVDPVGYSVPVTPYLFLFPGHFPRSNLPANTFLAATELKQHTQERIESNRGNRRKFNFGRKKKSKAEIEDDQRALKAELVMTEHTTPVKELLVDYGTEETKVC